MSKSMAIEGVMKIFLMIAVIIVGMSFLMKAFGIDIIGWLKEKFEGFDVPPEGKILHVRMDPIGPELWEFHLTDNPQHSSEGEVYFMLNEDSQLYRESCVIVSTDAESQQGQYSGNDKGYVFYIGKGAVIDAKCGDNLKECIRDEGFIKSGGCNEGATKFIGTDNEVCSPEGRCNLCINGDLNLNPSNQIICQSGTLQTDVNCGGEYNYIGCKDFQFLYNKIHCDEPTSEGGDGLLVEKINFQNDIKVASDGCQKNPSNCNLLAKMGKNNWDYKILNGIVCDNSDPNNAKWVVCKKPHEEISATVDGKNYQCGTDGRFYVWPPIGTPQEKTLVDDDFSSGVKSPGKLKSNDRTNAGYWDSALQNVVLTEEMNDKNGQLEYDMTDFGITPQTITSLTATFDMRTYSQYGGHGADATWFYLFSQTTPTRESGNTVGYRIAFDENDDEIQIWYKDTALYRETSVRSIDDRAGFPDQTHGITIEFTNENGKHKFKILYRDTDINPSTQRTIEKEFQPNDISGKLFGWGARTATDNNWHRIDNVKVDVEFLQ